MAEPKAPNVAWSMQLFGSSAWQIGWPARPERSRALPGTKPRPINVTPGSAAGAAAAKQTARTDDRTTDREAGFIRRSVQDGLEASASGRASLDRGCDDPVTCVGHLPDVRARSPRHSS